MRFSPEIGKRYRISREITVTSIRDVPHKQELRVLDKTGKAFRVSVYDWEELEQYVGGALYLDADRVLWKRRYDQNSLLPWIDLKTKTAHRDEVPTRPLERLYREGER